MAIYTAAQKALMTVRRCLKSPVIAYIKTAVDTYEKRVSYLEISAGGVPSHPYIVLETLVRPSDHAIKVCTQLTTVLYKCVLKTYKWTGVAWVIDTNVETQHPKPANGIAYKKIDNDTYQKVQTLSTWEIAGKDWVTSVVVLATLHRPVHADEWIENPIGTYKLHTHPSSWGGTQWNTLDTITKTEVRPTSPAEGSVVWTAQGSTIYIPSTTTYLFDKIAGIWSRHTSMGTPEIKPASQDGSKHYKLITVLKYEELIRDVSWDISTHKWLITDNSQSPAVFVDAPTSPAQDSLFWLMVTASQYKKMQVKYVWSGTTFVRADVQKEVQNKPIAPAATWVAVSPTVYSLRTYAETWVEPIWTESHVDSNTQTRPSDSGTFHVVGGGLTYYRNQITYTWETSTHLWTKHDTRVKTMARPSTHGVKHCATNKHQLQDLYTFRTVGDNGSWVKATKDLGLVTGQCGYAPIAHWSGTTAAKLGGGFGVTWATIIGSGSRARVHTTASWINNNGSGFQGNSLHVHTFIGVGATTLGYKTSGRKWTHFRNKNAAAPADYSTAVVTWNSSKNWLGTSLRPATIFSAGVGFQTSGGKIRASVTTTHGVWITLK